MSHVLNNNNGVTVEVLPLGGIIQRISVPDHSGRIADVVLGFDREDDYRNGHPYFGALIGRFGNRIANGRFSIEGHDYVLACNQGGHHLHGGYRGFDKVTWKTEADGRSLRLSYISADGEEGFPGELSVVVDYTLGDDDSLRIDYRATTTRPTPVNLTSHPYFNLAGHDQGPILEHSLQLRASCYTPVGIGLIPTGEIADVAGTPFDFRSPTAIGERIDAVHEQLAHGGGYDHNFVIDDADGSLILAARAVEPTSGRTLDVLTTEPGLQLYTGNSLDGIEGKDGARYGPRSGFCLETQHFPDSPHHPNFPSTILRPGDLYESTTVYHFSTIEPDA